MRSPDSRRVLSLRPRFVVVYPALLCALAGALTAATFGTPVAIGGQATGVALDGPRGVVYAANYTASRIDVISTAGSALQAPIGLSHQPNSLALSRDGRYLAATHADLQTPDYGVTVISLGNGGDTRAVALDTAPLAIAFGADGQALVVTSSSFVLLDPTTGSTLVFSSVYSLASNTAPVPAAVPTAFSGVSLAASGDGSVIYGIGRVQNDATRVLVFAYSPAAHEFRMSLWAPAPAGPLAISANSNGSLFMAGADLYEPDGVVLAHFPDDALIGGSAIDSARNVVYIQATAAGAQPQLVIADADNLTVRDRLLLPASLSGSTAIDESGSAIYGAYVAGVLTMPVGSLDQYDRIATVSQNMLFSGSWCQHGNASRDFRVENPGGGATAFAVSVSQPGVTVSASSPTTPALVTITVDRAVFRGTPGTIEVPITITSPTAVNVIPPVKLHINVREPDQRGAIFGVPGDLVDILPDPVRNRFYVLRQDTNEVQVYDGGTFQLIGTLRTGATPRTMALTSDNRFLLVGCDNSEVAQVFDLDTFQIHKRIVFPRGHFPRSIAVCNNVILAACHGVGIGYRNTLDRIFFESGFAAEVPNLGLFPVAIDLNTALTPSPAAGIIFGAMANGTVLVYNLGSDTFSVYSGTCFGARGSVTVISDHSFAAGPCIFDTSLGVVHRFDDGFGIPSGFSVVGDFGLRTTAFSPFGPGLIQRFDLCTGFIAGSIRISEAPVLPDEKRTLFPRTLAPLPNGEAIVSLTTSGFTVLPWDYEAGENAPRVTATVNAADFSTAMAPGGLISVFGTNLSSVTASAGATPLPGLLGDTCVTVNEQIAPLLYVSPNQINAQLPFETTGTASLVLHGPAAVSQPFEFATTPYAPALFRVPVQGWSQTYPTVIRHDNGQIVTLSNPIHLDDWLEIYATGMGQVYPSVETGAAGLADPLSVVLAQPLVTLGNTVLPVYFAGLAPGSVGLYQINVKVPFKNVQTGMEVPLSITQGGHTTTVKVRVVE